MTDAESDFDLARVHESIASLRRSTRRTLPLFLIGIVATLVAAGIALYFILTLSADLKEARASLRESQAALTQARLSLAKANATLVQTQGATGSEANSEQIAAAIKQVSVSQQDLRSASSSLTQASSKLPQPQASISLTGNWTDQYGTIYAVRQKGSSFGYRAAFRNAANLGPAGVGRAEGSVKGSNLSYTYRDGAGNRYQCTAVVAPDGQRIDETCRTKEGKLLTVGLVRT
jgi:hypothetical protein